MGEIKKEFCEKHQIEYESKVICKVLGQEIYSKCPECQKEIDKRIEAEKEEEKKRQREAHQRQREAWLLNAGISQRYIQEGFKETDFSKTHERYLQVKNGDFENTSNLVILGNCGIGKTFFAFRMIEIALQLGKEYKYIRAKELRDLFKQSKIDGLTRFNSVLNIDAFIGYADGIIVDEIDDIFDDLEVFKQLVAICYDKLKRVIVLGNCDSEDFKKRVEEKTYSRLSGAKLFKGNFKDLRR